MTQKEGLEQEVTNVFHKGPDNEEFRICGQTVSEAAIQLCPSGMKAAICDSR